MNRAARLLRLLLAPFGLCPDVRLRFRTKSLILVLALGVGFGGQLHYQWLDPNGPVEAAGTFD